MLRYTLKAYLVSVHVTGELGRLDNSLPCNTIQANNRRNQHRGAARKGKYNLGRGERRGRFGHAYLCERGAPCRGGWEGRSSSCSSP
jgi:hypothetical protein